MQRHQNQGPGADVESLLEEICLEVKAKRWPIVERYAERLYFETALEVFARYRLWAQEMGREELRSAADCFFTLQHHLWHTISPAESSLYEESMSALADLLAAADEPVLAIWARYLGQESLILEAGEYEDEEGQEVEQTKVVKEALASRAAWEAVAQEGLKRCLDYYQRNAGARWTECELALGLALSHYDLSDNLSLLTGECLEDEEQPCIVLARKAAKAYPDSARAHITMAEIIVGVCLTDEAEQESIEILEAARKNQKEYALGKVLAGQLSDWCGASCVYDNQRAIEVLTELHLNNPLDRDATYELRLQLELAGDREGQIELIERSLEGLQPASHWASFLRTELDLLRAGTLSEAFHEEAEFAREMLGDALSKPVKKGLFGRLFGK